MKMHTKDEKEDTECKLETVSHDAALGPHIKVRVDDDYGVFKFTEEELQQLQRWLIAIRSNNNLYEGSGS